MFIKYCYYNRDNVKCIDNVKKTCPIHEIRLKELACPFTVLLEHCLTGIVNIQELLNFQRMFLTLLPQTLQRYMLTYLLFPGGSDSKESSCNAGYLGSTPGLGRSPRGRHGNPLQYSCLENPQGQKSLVGYNPWGCKEWDTMEQLNMVQMLIYRLVSSRRASDFYLG